MNHASGAALQKISFGLVLFIAAAVGYLVVRERIRSQRRDGNAGPGTNAALAAALAAAPQAETASEKPRYAPLRPRLETNVVRVLTNRPVAPPPARSSAVTRIENILPAETVHARPNVIVDSPAVVAGSGGGTRTSVTGRALLRGNPPPAEKPLPMDAACGALRTTTKAPPLMTRLYLVNAEGALADVFVYIKVGAPAMRPAAARGTRPLLDQINCEYVPYVMGVQTGQVFTVRNSDTLFHNVHPLPKVPGNPERNVGQMVKGMMTPFTFPNPEVFVTFKCDAHPWMFAYVGVVDHPWFAVTDKNGNFTLPAGLPPGAYTLAALHRKAGEQTQQIKVTPEGVAPVTFTFEVPAEPAPQP